MITNKAIAKAAGVSETCVSQVLNQSTSARISVETRKRIFEIAKNMGYIEKPRPARREEVGCIVYVFGLAPSSEQFVNPWHFRLLYELQQHAHQENRRITFLATTSRIADIQEKVNFVRAMRPLGIVLDGTVPELLVVEVEKLGIPFVVAGETIYNQDPAMQDRVSTCSVDIEATIGQLVQWLHKKGAQSIVMVCGPLTLLINEGILRAYRKALANLGLPFNPSLVQVGDPQKGGEIMARFDHLGVSYDGILFGNPILASTALPFLQTRPHTARPLRIVVHAIPDCVLEPLQQITLCGTPCEDFVRELYQLLSAEINYPTRRKQHIVVPPSFREGSYTIFPRLPMTAMPLERVPAPPPV